MYKLKRELRENWSFVSSGSNTIESSLLLFLWRSLEGAKFSINFSLDWDKSGLTEIRMKNPVVDGCILQRYCPLSSHLRWQYAGFRPPCWTPVLMTHTKRTTLHFTGNWAINTNATGWYFQSTRKWIMSPIKTEPSQGRMEWKKQSEMKVHPD